MLETTHLSFAYNAGRPDAIPALQDVTVRIAPGELVAIIGHNGSGKSTLAKLFTAMLTPTEGSISVDGIPSTPENVWEVRRRVGMVFQRPDDQLVANTVIDDVAFGPENLGLPRDEIERRVRESLDALGLSDVAHAQISELSGGEKQRVAIAGVLAMQPSYLILDEPTTMIAPRMARQIIALAHDLRRRAGVAVLHITHFMREVVSFDRVIVMDGGRVLMDGAPHAIFARAHELQAVGLNVPLVTRVARRLRAHGVALPEAVLTAEELVVALHARGQGSGVRGQELGARGQGSGARGQELGDDGQRNEATQNGEQRDVSMADLTSQSPILDPQPPTPNPRSLIPDPRPLIEVRDLHYTYLAGTPLAQEGLRGVDCAVYEGETLAILGGMQAGKSTLIEFFNGLRLPKSGHVFFEGQDVSAPGFDLDLLRQSVGIVFQQPEMQLFEDTVGKDVSYAPRRKNQPPAESRAIVEQALTDVGLDYETFRLRYVYALSGGQKRRVAIAGVLAAQPRVLILDEPVAGLDPRGRADLAALIIDLTRRLGLTVVLVGNAVDELAQLANRALVMSQGRVVMEGTLRELLRRADELHALGLELSEPAEIALTLRSLFPDLPTDLLRAEELEEALLKRLEIGDWRLASGHNL
jgi:energy-coupling factor transport system ATP-binding protein